MSCEALFDLLADDVEVEGGDAADADGVAVFGDEGVGLIRGDVGIDVEGRVVAGREADVEAEGRGDAGLLVEVEAEL